MIKQKPAGVGGRTPGSIIEELKIIDPLVNPTAHGGHAEDAFDVVIPSMPGHGFSAKPTTAGWESSLKRCGRRSNRCGRVVQLEDAMDFEIPKVRQEAGEASIGLLGDLSIR